MKSIVLCILLLAGRAAAARKPITIDSLWDWRTVSTPQISPDGRSVVYVLGRADKMADAFYSNLWIATVDGKSQRPVTQGAFRDTSPVWSPDGTRLAYLSNRGGKMQIHVRWMDTGQDAEITDLEQAPAGIAWSPDGKWISYTSRVPARPAWSVPMPDKPKDAKWAEPPIVVTRLHWRNDGTGLIQPGDTQIFVVPAVGGTPRQISSGDYDHGGGTPSWTPDGESILASADRSPDAEYSLEGGEIYAFSVKDGALRQLTHRKGPDTNPVASPDGKRIAYIGYDYRPNHEYTVERLYVMDADGGHPKLLTRGLDRDASRPVWSADSRELFFTADDSGSTHIYRAALDGNVKQVATAPLAKSRSGGYAGSETMTMARNGRVAVVRSTPAEPQDVVTFPIDRPAEVLRLTASNDSLLAGYAIGAVEEVAYDSFDGRSIQGWIVKPPDFDPARKYPLILDIHGGPHAMYGVEFNHQMQMYAGRGFVVLYTNPRGSTGYGEEFGDIIHTKYPGDDYQDLMAGVDMMLAKGYIDPKRLGVTGGSGGGLLSAWIIGHTDRFAAAVVQYPVTNWITQVGTADGGYHHAASWMGAMPWDNPQQYLEHSPVFFAKNFKTPTMVITGEADLRTPIAQSEELYFALKVRKVDAVLVRIPDEPHGIRGAHPSHRLEKVAHILGWMEKYTR